VETGARALGDGGKGGLNTDIVDMDAGGAGRKS